MTVEIGWCDICGELTCVTEDACEEQRQQELAEAAADDDGDREETE